MRDRGSLLICDRPPGRLRLPLPPMRGTRGFWLNPNSLRGDP